MKFGDLSYEEIRARAAEGAVAVLPTGCTEQQGPHLSVDFDTWFAESLMLAAAELALQRDGLIALVLPAIPFGPASEHRNFGAGYMDIPADLHEGYVEACLRSLADQGFSRIVVWRGCGAHDLREVVERFNVKSNGRVDVLLPAMPYHDIWCRLADPSVPNLHAGSFTTSIALHLRPENVRLDRIPGPETAAIDLSDPDLDFSKHSKSGVIGDATGANRELGAELWEACVEAAAEVLAEAARLRPL